MYMYMCFVCISRVWLCVCLCVFRPLECRTGGQNCLAYLVSIWDSIVALRISFLSLHNRDRIGEKRKGLRSISWADSLHRVEEE